MMKCCKGVSVSTPQHQAAYNRGYITHQMSLAAVERDVGWKRYESSLQEAKEVVIQNSPGTKIKNYASLSRSPRTRERKSDKVPDVCTPKLTL